MSNGGSGQGAIYSPLPQSISDSESSEEELISIVPNNKNPTVSCKTGSVKVNGHKMAEYRPLGHENESDLRINGVCSRETILADDISTIKLEITLPNYPRPLSFLRKVFFVLSVLLCFLTCIIFLWVLPCDVGTCPSNYVKPSTQAWERTLDGFELVGKISVVPGVSGNNLIFLLRANIMTNSVASSGIENAEHFAPGEGGIISLLGSTGEVAWWKKLHLVPRDIDCSLIDITGDGKRDCIVVGNELMSVVEPLSGNTVWFLHSHQFPFKADDIEFPLILPDLDQDGTNELLTACAVSDSHKTTTPTRNNLILISGKMGKLLGPPLLISECISITNIMLDYNWHIHLLCRKSPGLDIKKVIPVSQLFTNITNRSWHLDQSKIRLDKLKQHRLWRPTGKNQFEILRIGDWRMSVVNMEKCPVPWRTEIRVYKLTSDQYRYLYNYTENNVYTMAPVVLNFQKKSFAGVILKFWIWNHENPKSILNQLYSARRRRKVPISSKIPEPVNLSEHWLQERVVLMTVNATSKHAVNTSLSDILQLCTNENENCQPDPMLQHDSLLVTDLDGDGSRELISYLSTFSGTKPTWNLHSHIRLIRLEAELPKLYEEVVH